jgi:octanoyl-[GcvH]:protein N-octanoyltransferase
MTTLDLITSGPSAPADLEMACSEALLRAVAAGRRPATLRILRPAPTVAFGRLDALGPGFAAAVEGARGHGFQPVVRVAGGHAAAYDPGSLVVEAVTPQAGAVTGLQDRFDDAAAALLEALLALGLDARVGRLDGEYCPGAHSLNVGGRLKVAGIAQRVVKGAALTSAVLTVGSGDLVRRVVADVYDALGIAIDPAVTGALQDVAPALEPGAVQDAVLAAYARRAGLRPVAMDGDLLAAAEALRGRHAVA